MGNKTNEIKIQKWVGLVGTEYLDCPKVEGGVLGRFTTRGMVKTRMDQNQRTAQNQKGFFLKKLNPRNAFEKKNSEERFLRRV